MALPGPLGSDSNSPAIDSGTLQRIPHLLPQGLVRELAYTGRKFMAAEARGYGFVNT